MWTKERTYAQNANTINNKNQLIVFKVPLINVLLPTNTELIILCLNRL